MNTKRVYMDYAATTPVKPEVLQEMLPYFTENFGNPSSLYSFSDETKEAIITARKKIAHAINADKSEIYFTGSGSEADNWAIKGIAMEHKNKGNHIITTKIEHHAVINTCKYLEKNGFEITYLPVNEEGFISIEDLQLAITDKTILVSIMFANNEIGTLEPIKKIGELCRERKIFFHTDAVQAVGHVNIDVEDMKIDLLSMSGHKFYGPKGIGALYVRRGVKLENLIHGGSQERGKRASTENIASIVGIGKAIEIATEELELESERLKNLSEKLTISIVDKIPYTKINGPTRNKRLPGNVNLSFIGVEGEALLLDLDLDGIYASTGSACASGATEPSHVLLAIGLQSELAHGSLRLTIGVGTTEEDIDYVAKKLSSIVERIRKISPSWKAFIEKKDKK
ncbi:cysteine desulfurase NifS [Clostridium akagii]|uniref:cysteine desulfurase NifS n=1 Tax=Clostridium akagii TaxID=91623 RepID=UPI00047D1651|nr:cysteine desulfurase NifS [Clostridium akagii]